ncbi:MAG TPA: phosphatidate cytidylyltransferase, partial [Gammaproteobacteria bacterium]
MLKARVATAAVLIPAVVGGVLLLDTRWFAALAGLIFLLGAWEWLLLAGYPRAGARIGFLFLAAAGVLLWPWIGLAAGPLALGASLGWLLGLIWVHAYQSGSVGAGPAPVRIATGLMVLLPAWTSLVALHARNPDGRWWVLFLLVMIWIADTAAFFAGRRFGRRRLASAVSPGKSWEGVFAGLLGGLGVGVAFGLYRDMQGVEILVFLMVCACTVAASVIGDLLESMMKRSVNVKDSGSL